MGPIDRLLELVDHSRANGREVGRARRGTVEKHCDVESAQHGGTWP